MRVRTEKWHNYEEGDYPRDGSNISYYKKGFWKRYDRKKFLRWRANVNQVMADEVAVWDLEDNEYLTDNNQVIVINMRD